MKMDLHLHSTYSDGTDDLLSIFKKAKGLDLIALTDHNTLKGNQEFQHLLKEYNQDGLLGIEMTVDYLGHEIHLLGYFNPDSDLTSPFFQEINDLNDATNLAKVIVNQKMVEKLQQDYPALSYEDFLAYHASLGKTNHFNRVHISQYLVYKKICTDIQDGFDRFIGDECKYYVKKENTSLFTAFQSIINAGGIPSIAHLKQYNLSNEEIKTMLVELSALSSIFAIELFHYDHLKKDIMNYYSICQEVMNETNCKILFSAGSDFHGNHKPNLVGVPYQFQLDIQTKELLETITKEWIEWIKSKRNI